MSNRFLVIPSNREDGLKEFFQAWEGKGGWDKIILIEDGPERSFFPQEPSVLGKDNWGSYSREVEISDTQEAYHYSWEEIRETLKHDDWIISRKDSAIRCFGFLMAYRMGADYVLTLDDDCFPMVGCQDLFARHIEILNQYERWTSTIPWIETRGIPYRNKGKLTTVVASMGHWANCADFDAVQTLNRATLKIPSIDFPDPFLLPNSVYAPICGMNLCIKREALPLFYFPLMGEGQPYRRFDDIWAGIIAKKLCDTLGWHISVGGAFIDHQKASDPFANLVKEAPGIQANEWFWETLDAIVVAGTNAREAVFNLADNLQQILLHTASSSGFAKRTSAEILYLNQLRMALQVWARLFEEGAK